MDSRPASAQLFLRERLVIVQPVAAYPGGGGLVEDFVLTFELPSDHVGLGRFVREALDARRIVTEDPDPKRWDTKGPLLRAAGVRSMSDFRVGARSVDIRRRKESTKVQPLQDLGGRKGWYADVTFDPPIQLTNPTDDELGRAVVRALHHFDE
jgi:hypothetical protein